MSWFTKIRSADTDSFEGRILLLVLDKLLIGAIIAVALGVYDRYRTVDQRGFEKEMVDVQVDFERTRLTREILPHILDKRTDVVARGHILSSALSAGHLDAGASIDVASALLDQGIPESQFIRVAKRALPEGLEAVALHGARLRAEAKRLGTSDLGWAVEAVELTPEGWQYAPAPSLTPELQAIQKERLLWGRVLRAAMPHASETQEERIATQEFLATHASSLYFLVYGAESGTFEETELTGGRLLGLLTALECVITDVGATREAADYVGAELASLDLTTTRDLTFALALVELIREYGRGSDSQTARIAPEISVHLARLLVDDSFLHRVPWISDDASAEERRQWLLERPAAGRHGSLQFAAGEVLTRIGSRAGGAEDVLIPYTGRLVRDVEEARGDAVGLLAARHGKHLPRFAVAVLGAMDTAASSSAVQEVRELDPEKLAEFFGIVLELEALSSGTTVPR